MADNSLIEWTNSTWNPVTGCTKVSPGCDNCYIPRTAAFRIQHRAFDREGIGGTTGVLLHPDRLDLPLRWRTPRRVFVNSLSDLFHDSVPDEYIARVWQVMATTPQHTYQILTKRPARMRAWVNRCKASPGGWITHDGTDPKGAYDGAGVIVGYPDFGKRLDYRGPRGGKPRHNPQPVAYGWPLPNVWLGVSVESQQWADIRIPALLETPAAVRWLSCEPLLGPVNLYHWIQRDDPDGECATCGAEEWTGQAVGGHPKVHYCVDGVCTTAGGPDCPMAGEETGEWCPGPVKPYPRPDWVVVGGESGPGARPMHPEWARSLRDQCQVAGVPFFFKQWGEWTPDGTGQHQVTKSRYRYDVEILGPDGELYRAAGPQDISPDWATLYRKGKHAAGRELDGRTWDEYPQAVA